jgi:hypothetical protein
MAWCCHISNYMARLDMGCQILTQRLSTRASVNMSVGRWCGFLLVMGTNTLRKSTTEGNENPNLKLVRTQSSP